jgi:hypothetical protein
VATQVDEVRENKRRTWKTVENRRTEIEETTD